MARIRRGAFLAPGRDCAKRRPGGVSPERAAHGAGAGLIAGLGAGGVTGCVASDGTALVSMESSVRTLVAVKSQIKSTTASAAATIWAARRDMERADQDWWPLDASFRGCCTRNRTTHTVKVPKNNAVRTVRPPDGDCGPSTMWTNTLNARRRLPPRRRLISATSSR